MINRLKSNFAPSTKISSFGISTFFEQSEKMSDCGPTMVRPWSGRRLKSNFALSTKILSFGISTFFEQSEKIIGRGLTLVGSETKK